MIDESKLRKLKLLSNLAAALSLVVFIVLIGYSAMRLHRLNEQIASNTLHLEEVMKKKTELEKQTRELESTVRVLEDRKTRLESVLDKIHQEDAQVYERAMARGSTFTTQLREEIAPLVYIHISDESQRRRAQKLAEVLQESGYTVPDIENVSGKPGAAPPEKTQLRLFPGFEAEDKERLLRILDAKGINPALRTLQGVGRPNQYELWFGTDER